MVFRVQYFKMWRANEVKMNVSKNPSQAQFEIVDYDGTLI